MTAVTVCDVAPRDGLQNEPTVLAPTVRAELAARLARAGVPRVEVASFVNPDRVPQMVGAEEVVAELPGGMNAEWGGLVLNERGYERARSTGLGRINVTVAATDAFCRRNQGHELEHVLASAERQIARAREDGIAVTATLAVAFGCPFEGPVPAERAVAVAERIAAAGPDEIVVADTIGVAVPTGVRGLLARLDGLGPRLGCHFHDSRNTGVANVVAALDAGVDLFDASVGGTGGCPFAPGASGNVATEDVVYALHRMGLETGIDLTALLDCSAWLAERLGRELPSAVGRAERFIAHG